MDKDRTAGRRTARVGLAVAAVLCLAAGAALAEDGRGAAGKRVDPPRTPAQGQGATRPAEKPSSVFDEGYLPLTIKKGPPAGGEHTPRK